jgi:hypothetical protein
MTIRTALVPTDIIDPATGEPLYIEVRVRPRWQMWILTRLWRVQLFLGIVWRRIDTRIPDRLDWRTAWDVARGVHP